MTSRLGTGMSLTFFLQCMVGKETFDDLEWGNLRKCPNFCHILGIPKAPTQYSFYFSVFFIDSPDWVSLVSDCDILRNPQPVWQYHFHHY
jgi:hypothetical protein